MKLLFKTSLALATAVVIASTPLAMAKGKKLKPGENEFSASESIQVEAIAPPIASNMDNTSFTYEISEAAELPNLIKAEIFSKKTEQDRSSEDNASDSSKYISEVVDIQPMIYDPAYIPGCTELPMGMYFSWTPASGQQACVYVDVPVEAKYEFWIGNQTVNVQADILINHDINANYGLSYVDQTSTTGIDDESLYLHLEAGHYYFFVPATVANGGTLHFGVRSASNVDAYEKTTGAPNYWGNDLGGEGYNITGDFNYFSATLDNSGDIDNYEYILEDGVEMVLGVEDGELSAGSVQLELWAGGMWYPIATNNQVSIAPTLDPQTIQFRVRYADTANKNQGNKWYNLTVGKRIANIDNLTPGSTEAIERMPSYVGVTQFHKELEWGARIEDSNGDPIEGIVLIYYFDYDTRDIDGVGFQYDYGVTNSLGEFSNTMTFTPCDKSDAEKHVKSSIDPFTSHHTFWESWYNKGFWYMEVPQARLQDEIGIGHPTGEVVSLLQICKQELSNSSGWNNTDPDHCNYDHCF